MSKAALLGGEPVRDRFYKHTTKIGEEEKQLVLEVLESEVLSGFAASNDQRFDGGKMVREVERLFCEYFGTKYAVSFNSATSALHAAVAACGIGPGDEVITSPFTMTATPSSILHANGIPVFADIEESTYGLDPGSTAEKITYRTKGIIAVNLFGHPARLDELKSLAAKNELFLIEDNSQSPGARFKGRHTGTIGNIGIFSLNYHKIFQCGEGGVAITDSEELALKMRLIRNHGEVVVEAMKVNDISNTLGWNYRMTELQAAVAIPQFKKMESLIKYRVNLAEKLTHVLKKFDFLSTPHIEDNCDHVYYLYPISFNEEKAGIPRKIFCEAIRAENFPVIEGYIKPIYLEPLYQRKIAYGKQGCPFNCHYYNGLAQYGQGMCAVAERMWEKKLIIANFAKYPYSDKDMELFGAAVERIMNYKQEILNSLNV